MLTSTTHHLVTSTPVGTPLINTPITTIPTLTTPLLYNQEVTDSGCCTPTPGQNNTGSTWCAPNTLSASGYNTRAYGQQAGTSSCCAPNVNQVGVNALGAPIVQNNSSGCCGPTYQVPQNQGVVGSGLCGPTSAGAPGVSSCCGPSIPQYGATGVINPQYSTGGFCAPSQTGGVSNCCGPKYPTPAVIAPTVNTGLCGPSLPGQASSGCCGPSVQPGVVGQYNTSGFCSPSTGCRSNCCKPTVGPNGVIIPPLCEDPCGPPVLVPGIQSPGLCGNLCAPSISGGEITDCCSPTISRPGNSIPSTNALCGTNCCTPSIQVYSQPGITGGYRTSGAISNCCGPTLSPNGVINQPACGNLCGPTIPSTVQLPSNYTYSQGGFCSGPISSCCEPNADSTYLVEERAKVRDGIVSRQVQIIEEIPNTNTYVFPSTSTIQPVNAPMTSYVSQSIVSTPDIVETSPVEVPTINLNPTENLSPEAFAILQAIQSDLPVSNLGIKFSDPVYLTEKQGIYVGQWVNNSMNGYGKLYFDNGGYFEGQFTNGIANTANGCFVYPDGSYYIGSVSNNFANGQGVYTYKNNTLIYKGSFVNDQPEGRGTQYYADDSRYEGDFRFGRKEGRGSFYWRDGTVYTGQFEGGFMQGYGIHHLSNGEIYEGEFRKNRRHGIGRLVNSFGVYNGGFKNDSKEGEGRFEWTDGRKFQGTFRNGKPDGPGTLTLSGGKVVNGNWIDGVLDTESLDTSFGASQIGSLGALGGPSAINTNRGSSVLQTNIRTSLAYNSNIYSANNLGATFINNPFPAITSTIPQSLISIKAIPTVVPTIVPVPIMPAPILPTPVVPLFTSRVTANSVVPTITSAINTGIPQVINSTQVITPPVTAFQPLGISNVPSIGVPFGSGISIPPVNAFSGVAANYTSRVGLAQTALPVPGPVAVPNILPPVSVPVPTVLPQIQVPITTLPPPQAPVAALLPPKQLAPLPPVAAVPFAVPPPVNASFNGLGLNPPSTSPFLGGSLNGSFSPSFVGGFDNTSILPNRGIGGLNGPTGFTQTTSIIPSFGIGGAPAGLAGLPSGPNGIAGVNPPFPGTNGRPSTGGLPGIQKNDFFPAGFPSGVNGGLGVTPVGRFGAAPTGIPFMNPTGVPPVGIPRGI